MGRHGTLGRESQGVGCSDVNRGTDEGQEKRSAFVPGGPLVHEPRAGGIAGFAENDVQSGVGEVREVGGESLGRAEAAAHLFNRGAIAALRLRAGSGGNADQVSE